MVTSVLLLLPSFAMFLLRCTFWLSIVYASMSWGGGALRHHASFEAATADRNTTLEAVAEGASDGVASFCRNRETQCLKDAALMTTLVQTTLRSEEADESIVQDANDVPLPAPRRRVASSMLTRMR